jgi:hypothetical protein
VTRAFGVAGSLVRIAGWLYTTRANLTQESFKASFIAKITEIGRIGSIPSLLNVTSRDFLDEAADIFLQHEESYPGLWITTLDLVDQPVSAASRRFRTPHEL